MVSNMTEILKAQKGSKDIIKIVHVTVQTRYEEYFLRKENKQFQDGLERHEGE